MAQKSTTGAELLTVFFDYRGIVHHSYAPEGQTINKEYYLEVIRHLRDAVRSKRPGLWASRNWQLHHDNAPAHSSQLIQSFLTKHGIAVVRQAPYSPDMASCDFWLFPKLKRTLKGSRFDSREDIMRNATKELRSFPEEAFEKCFQQWKESWDKFVESQGAYFEGDYELSTPRYPTFFPGLRSDTFWTGRYVRNVGAATSHNTMDLHALLQEQLYLCCDRGFECHSRHGCLFVFILFLC
jgi:transposase